MGLSVQIEHGFAVLKVLTNDLRGDSVPAGLAVWDSARQWYLFKCITENEKASGLSKEQRMLVGLAEGQIRRWADAGRVPGADGAHPAWASRFWHAVQTVLASGVVLDGLRAMEPLADPDEEADALYEAIVRPKRSVSTQRVRVDGVVSKALGDVAKRVPRHTAFAAFGGVQETVLRGVAGSRGSLIVEGVNLAGPGATHDADALVSRLERILAANTKSNMRLLVGYRSSPNGLNGETHLRDWIAKRVASEVFDLVRERDVLKERAAAFLTKIGVPA